MTDSREREAAATPTPTRLYALPLRVVIPAVLLLFTVAVGAWAYLAGIRFSGRAETQGAVVRLTRETTTLQRTLEYLFTKDALEEVQQELAERGADPAIEAAVVIDDRTRVIASANRALLGQNLDQQLDQLGMRRRGVDLAPALREAQARHQGQVLIASDGNLIVAVYPVVLGAAPGQLRADRLGALIIARELESVRALGRREMARLTTQIVFPMAFFAVLLLVGSHFVVTRRVTALVRAAGRFAGGDRNARAGLTGRDELAQVGRAFDDMAGQVAAGQRVLADRVRTLAKLSELSMKLTGDPAGVFDHVVRMIGELFEVRVVCLSQIQGRELLFKAVYANGKVVRDAGGCPIDTTPCSTVEDTKDIRVYDRVMERFPQASFLRDYHAQAYCGVPSVDGEGRVVAVTCLLDDKPREFTEEDRQILGMIGQRIAVEVERGRHLAERKRAEQRLQDSLQEKEVLLKEIYHRVKNNLQVISSLLYLQSQSITDAALRDLFQESINRVASMSLVHEQLYQSTDLAQVDFAKYTGALADSLFQSYGVDRSRIALQLEMDAIALSITAAIPCGLIMNEVVSNALKHAFPDGRQGRMAIRCRLEGGVYCLEVSDDGVGMPPNGTVYRPGALGVRLIERLVGQLSGTLTRTGPPGTVYQIRFPAQHTKGG